MSLVKGRSVNTNKALKMMKNIEKNKKLEKILKLLNRLFLKDEKTCDFSLLTEILSF
jgi:hypothetical protein